MSPFGSWAGPRMLLGKVPVPFGHRAPGPAQPWGHRTEQSCRKERSSTFPVSPGRTAAPRWVEVGEGCW